MDAIGGPMAPPCVGPCPLAGNCTYQSVDALNQGLVNPLLKQLVRTAFFRYFKVGP